MKYGAVVLGGGPAGSCAAYFLARKGWSVAVLERKEFPRRKVCGEYLSATNWPLLRELHITDEFLAGAGPEVTRVGLFSGTTSLSSPLPRSSDAWGWGRALGRDVLDQLLLKRATEAGAEVLQPWDALGLRRENGDWIVHARSEKDGAETELRASLVIAANGSWDPGSPVEPPRRAPQRGSDLFGFKAHFRRGELAAGLMPLLAFPGGYGGLVESYRGLLSLSCCVRRDLLGRLDRSGGVSAGDAILTHILKTCPAARPAFEKAQREGDFISAGPLRPGLRRLYKENVFRAGNAAGEAHPVVAEGISMALQSGWLLARSLGPSSAAQAGGAFDAAGLAYTKAWRSLFVSRIRAAAFFAHVAMRPLCARGMTAVLRCVPAALTWCAAWSGKMHDPGYRFPDASPEVCSLP